MTDANLEELQTLFTSIGLDKQKAAETAKNKKLAATLKDIITEANVEQGAEKSLGNLLYILAGKLIPEAAKHKKYLVAAILSGKLKNEAQIAAAVQYLKSTQEFKEADFEEECGVGVVITDEELSNAIDHQIESRKDAILAERYQFTVGLLLKAVRDSSSRMKWADGKLLKEKVDNKIEQLLGPKTEEDLKPKPKKKEPKAPETKPTANVAASDGEKKEVRAFEGAVLKFHKPHENVQLRPDILEAHLKATGGKVMTRFPPEPNGYLHIGHAKAINFNFSYAEVNGGHCYLRYDDTNPEAEEAEFFSSIEDMVRWLGFTPYQITHSSDNFDRLYELAVDLIKRGKAYVCHQTAEEMHKSRGGDNKGPRSDSPWRNRPVEESLAEFENMRKGKYAEGEATLRMKIDMQSGNPYMWDPVAYRILYTAHVKTGDKWCIYPTYDFTHCLCDSFENITHSLCTTEFVPARESYYWLCNSLEVYRPVQWEYGRLNITNTVLSKRKLTALVQKKIVHGWDDPRIYTIVALRRRGFTPKAINDFVRSVGITTSESTVDVKLLEAFVRDDLNLSAPRVMAVLDPIEIEITNYPESKVEEFEFPNNPVNSAQGSRKVPFARRLFIDRSDFKDDAKAATDPNWFRLSPGGVVGLLKGYVVKCESVERDASGKPIKLLCVADLASRPGVNVEAEFPGIQSPKLGKAKTYIQWVAVSPAHLSPARAEVRLYNPLFKSSNPAENPDGWLADINPDSLEVKGQALVEPSLLNAKDGDRFQFMRLGYFAVDKDTDFANGKFVFNRTVTLKEDSHKE